MKFCLNFYRKYLGTSPTIRLYIYLPICLYIYLPICLYIYLPISICMYIYLPICLYICLPICLYICLPICLYIYLPICLYINSYLHICLYIYLPIYLYTLRIVYPIANMICSPSNRYRSHTRKDKLKGNLKQESLSINQKRSMHEREQVILKTFQQ